MDKKSRFYGNEFRETLTERECELLEHVLNNWKHNGMPFFGAMNVRDRVLNKLYGEDHKIERPFSPTYAGFHYY